MSVITISPEAALNPKFIEKNNNEKKWILYYILRIYFQL